MSGRCAPAVVVVEEGYSCEADTSRMAEWTEEVAGGVANAAAVEAVAVAALVSTFEAPA